MKAAVYKGNGVLSVEEGSDRMPGEKEVQIKVGYAGQISIFCRGRKIIECICRLS